MFYQDLPLAFNQRYIEPALSGCSMYMSSSYSTILCQIESTSDKLSLNYEQSGCISSMSHLKTTGSRECIESPNHCYR